ncbi:probable caffeoyl-CoA O-methyltransferase 2 [Hyalella azteca]|uniref:Probable caffeoyl-CoA O-methyltransferase 2 n=1 Tax=Hyalella azteca TaxID=294128 RepID=A0A8B7PBJ9_HYAAZ|nr:probable caffeoyl-CoA O-methyltransferase 2 [Hyalella azteca]XP_018023376.1 probable caffeoyl-CoA O-methyltransferase 2 [Hyalella azteca]
MGRVGLMMGAPEVLQLTANLIRAIGGKRVLDIGMFTGSSALSAALALPDDGQVYGFDISEEYVKHGYPFFEKAGVKEKIKIHFGPAMDNLQKLVDDGQSGTFDFAFIDADKENYWGYYELCLLLVRRGGIIAVDNTLWSGRVFDTSHTDECTVAIREFNDKVHRDSRVRVSFLPIGDGLSLLFVQ